MDVVRKQWFWILMSALALGALAFYCTTTAFGRNAEIEKEQRKLESQRKKLDAYAKMSVTDPNTGLPVKALADYWEGTLSEVKREKQEIAKKYAARDREFKKLLGADAQGKVEVPRFVSLLKDRRDKELAQPCVKAKLLHDSEPSTVEKVFPIEIGIKPGEDEKMAIAQKEFNIAKAVVVAARAAGVVELEAMSFKVPEKDPKAEVKPLEKIACTVDLKIPFPNLPALVSALLKANAPTSPDEWTGGPPILEVAEMEVAATSFTLPEYDPYKAFTPPPSETGFGTPAGSTPGSPVLKGFENSVYVATSMQSDPSKPALEAPELREPPVGVKLVLDALDFNLTEAEAPK